MRRLSMLFFAVAGLAFAPGAGQAHGYWHGPGYYRPPVYRYRPPPPVYYRPPPPPVYYGRPPAYFPPPPRYWAVPPPPPPGFGFYLR